MSASRSRIPAFARWSALPVGLVLSAALVWQSSYAAFTATTTNPTNNWATGSVALADDDSNAALFTTATNAGNLKPGATATKCIRVNYTGTLASNVKLYTTAASYAETLSLGSYIDLEITQGTGTAAFTDTEANCIANFVADAGPVQYTGTLANFASTRTNFSNGFGTFAPSGTATKVYKIKYTINASTPNGSQGATAALGFSWEAQNT